MKLIKPVEVSIEEITLDVRPLATYEKLFGKDHRKEPILKKFAGRTTLSNVLIQFDVPPLLFVRRDKPVVFGDVVYHGIIPLALKEDNTYICSIDYFTSVEIGEV